MNYLTAPLMDGPSVQPDNALTGGQARRAWINALADRVGEYIPPELRGGVNMLSMLNPVNDVGEAMQNSRVMMDASRSGRERFDAGVDMATNMAAVLAPVVAGKIAGSADDAADVVDALLGFGGPTREAATDYAKRFAADESGAIKLPIGRGDDLESAIRRQYPDAKISLRGGPDRGYTLSQIVVPEAQRNSGVGSEIMGDIARAADSQGARVALSPSSDFGGSAKRLKEFYKRFGFVENKGRNKDFSISETMYRDPIASTDPATQRGAMTPADEVDAWLNGEGGI